LRNVILENLEFFPVSIRNRDCDKKKKRYKSKILVSKCFHVSTSLTLRRNTSNENVERHYTLISPVSFALTIAF